MVVACCYLAGDLNLQDHSLLAGFIALLIHSHQHSTETPSAKLIIQCKSAKVCNSCISDDDYLILKPEYSGEAENSWKLWLVVPIPNRETIPRLVSSWPTQPPSPRSYARWPSDKHHLDQFHQTTWDPLSVADHAFSGLEGWPKRALAAADTPIPKSDTAIVEIYRLENHINSLNFIYTVIHLHISLQPVSLCIFLKPLFHPRQRLATSTDGDMVRNYCELCTLVSCQLAITLAVNDGELQLETTCEHDLFTYLWAIHHWTTYKPGPARFNVLWRDWIRWRVLWNQCTTSRYFQTFFG